MLVQHGISGLTLIGISCIITIICLSSLMYSIIAISVLLGKGSRVILLIPQKHRVTLAATCVGVQTMVSIVYLLFTGYVLFKSLTPHAYLFQCIVLGVMYLSPPILYRCISRVVMSCVFDVLLLLLFVVPAMLSSIFWGVMLT